MLSNDTSFAASYYRRVAQTINSETILGAVDKNEGVVKRHLFSAMLCSTAWISERWRTEALKLSR